MQAVRIYGTNRRSQFRTHGDFPGGDLPPAFVQLVQSRRRHASVMQSDHAGIAAKGGQPFWCFWAQSTSAKLLAPRPVTMIPAKLPSSPGSCTRGTSWQSGAAVRLHRSVCPPAQPSPFCCPSSSSSKPASLQAWSSRPQPHTHGVILACRWDMSTCIPNVNTLLGPQGPGPARAPSRLRARHHGSARNIVSI